MYQYRGQKVCIISGGFDPIHVGHIELIKQATIIGDLLLVILNTDEFLTNKKKRPFMKFEERKIIVESIKGVDLVIKSIDKDQTVCETLKKLNELKDKEDLVFCNGGDRTNGANTPEHKLCEELGIGTIYGLGEKIQSSSWLTNEKKS
ncbi:MAG TPA: cytidyltransferase [Nitrospinaceae bacterium]|nr:cytidyltransferase [Nitrospinaceae bacterium]